MTLAPAAALTFVMFSCKAVWPHTTGRKAACEHGVALLFCKDLLQCILYCCGQDTGLRKNVQEQKQHYQVCLLANPNMAFQQTFASQIEARELQAEAERMEREMELERAREAERQKKLDEAAAKQRAREKEIEEREVSCISLVLPQCAALGTAGCCY